MQTLRGFGLDYEPPVDDHVESLPGEWLSSKMDQDRDLSLDPMALGNQVPFHRERVDVLAKSKPELRVDIKESADDGARKRLLEQPSFALGSHPFKSVSIRSIRITDC